jgi:hypothetical protein
MGDTSTFTDSPEADSAETHIIADLHTCYVMLLNLWSSSSLHVKYTASSFSEPKHFSPQVERYIWHR